MKKTTKKEFLEKANLKYNNFFDYSKINYIDLNTKIKIICPIHGEFEQSPSKHIDKSVVYGCQKCALSNFQKNRKLKVSGFIEKSIEKFGNIYDYSKVIYENNKTKVIITCSIHGDFEQSPSVHLKSQGCPKCTKDSQRKHKVNDEINNILSYKDFEIINNPIKTSKTHVIGSIYLFINKINNKVYVGKTIDSFASRFSKHLSNALELNLQNYFYKAIRKYGYENFDKYVIFQTEELEKNSENKKLLDEIVCKKEIEFIEKFKSNNPKIGYNLTTGGDGVAGFNFSEESKKRMSESRKGELHSNYGVKNRAGKAVCQYDKEMNFIAEYPSISEAGRALDRTTPSIINCCKGKKELAHGYIWKYKNLT